MKIFNTCSEALEMCISKSYFAIAHLYNSEKPIGTHIHDCYELYYSVSGAKQFLINNQFYPVEPGDAFFVNQFESHCLTCVDSGAHERIVIFISPAFLKSISTEATDLDACFREHPPGRSHRIPLTPEEQKRFRFYIDNLRNTNNFGSDIMERSVFSLLMVYITKRYLKFIRHRSVPLRSASSEGHGVKVDGILSYINQHLDESISLEQIAEQFYLSTSYVCRIFKAATGTTINQYMIAKRISKAKELLRDGMSAADVAVRCGFGDYSNFYKAFIKSTKVSPKNYVQLSTYRELTEN